jgi:hypothetical protein
MMLSDDFFVGRAGEVGGRDVVVVLDALG